jgi:hypothetical protein
MTLVCISQRIGVPGGQGLQVIFIMAHTIYGTWFYMYGRFIMIHRPWSPCLPDSFEKVGVVKQKILTPLKWLFSEKNKGILLLSSFCFIMSHFQYHPFLTDF